MNIFLKINVLIFSFLISSCSSGNNVEKSSNKLDERIYVFEKKSNLESSSEINYSRFAPVNQLNLKGMPVDFRKIINILEKKGYINTDKVSSINRYEVISYNSTTKKIYFFNNGNEKPDLFSEIYATSSKFNQLESIRLGLSAGYDGEKFKQMSTDTTIPTSFISALNVIDEKKAKEIYGSLINQHILNIKKNVNEYCGFLVTTRVKVQDYWFELNTEQIKNNTYFNIYQSDEIPKKCDF